METSSNKTNNSNMRPSLTQELESKKDSVQQDIKFRELLEEERLELKKERVDLQTEFQKERTALESEFERARVDLEIKKETINIEREELEIEKETINLEWERLKKEEQNYKKRIRKNVCILFVILTVVCLISSSEINNFNEMIMNSLEQAGISLPIEIMNMLFFPLFFLPVFLTILMIFL